MKIKNTNAVVASVLALASACACASVARAADVKENWEKNCASCHGKDGKAETKAGRKAGAKDLTDAKLQAELKDDKAFASVKEGTKDSAGKELMKPFKDKLSDDEIKALVGYVRQFKK